MSSAASSEQVELGHGSRRGFWALIATQFFGAFNDNALRVLVTFVAVAAVAGADRWAAPVAGALFSIPFILFSMAGGFLADRFSKRRVTIAVKVFEIGVMCLALAGLALGQISLLFVAVLLMGVHSAFFGPSKYGLLPELLPPQRLSWGNGIIEMGTMLAIILGIASAGELAVIFQGELYLAGTLLLAVAVIGWLASFSIDRVPPADPARRFQLNYWKELTAQWRLIRTDRVLRLAILGNTYFWFLGMLLQTNIIGYGEGTLHLAENQIGYLLVALAVGIGLGSVAAGKLSGQRIEYGLIPVGALGLTVFAFVLAMPGLSYVWALADLGLLGFFGGFFVVPVNALIQHRPEERHKGGVIAFANLLSFVGTFIASGLSLAAGWAHVSPLTLFLVSGFVTLAGTGYVLVLLPESLIRLVLWLLTHTLYRVRVVGRENVPEKGGALFVCNHLSFVDVLLLIAATDRPIRFVMHRDFYDIAVLRPFARLMRAIPVSSKMRPRELLAALKDAGNGVREGDIVCIFAEGQISRIGQLLPFARGLERIMRGNDAPIVPVCLDGVWGSVFSFSKQRFFWKTPERPLEPVTVCYGKPMPPTAAAVDVRQAVQELLSDAWSLRQSHVRTLDRALIRTARRHPFRLAMADARGSLRWGAALTKATYLARRLRPVWEGQEKVGILLPPSSAGALVNHAALLLGKVPVNLNYTVSDSLLASCAAQCQLETVVTSRAFLEKVKLTVPGRTVLLEDVAAAPRVTEKLAALVISRLVPAFLVGRALRADRQRRVDDLATVIFSSGSTGDPKGVMLTHFSITANVQQLGQIFALTKRDRIVGILPFFHSFGYTATLALPAVLGVAAVFHVSPLDARTIGSLVSSYAATLLLSTPTFLQTYIRRCSAESFGSLRYVVAGAEKLSDRVATAFEEHFGVRPLEGYGCTECSPVVCVNSRDFRAAGFRQIGAKRGKIGHPLPGVSVRIADLETLAPLPTGQSGMLLVRGPNVMKGYLGRPEKTAEVMRDGWYVTGDVAVIDADGFVQITDRLSRFSKIGGEMVPHVRVEEALHELLAEVVATPASSLAEQTFVACGVPDEKRGERLVVLHLLSPDRLAGLLARLPSAGLPALWVPRTRDFFRVESFPCLGTGKLDLRRVRDLALERAQASGVPVS